MIEELVKDGWGRLVPHGDALTAECRSFSPAALFLPKRPATPPRDPTCQCDRSCARGASPRLRQGEAPPVRETWPPAFAATGRGRVQEHRHRNVRLESLRF